MIMLSLKESNKEKNNLSLMPAITGTQTNKVKRNSWMLSLYMSEKAQRSKQICKACRSKRRSKYLLLAFLLLSFSPLVKEEVTMSYLTSNKSFDIYNFHKNSTHLYLVGGFNPSEKYK